MKAFGGLDISDEEKVIRDAIMFPSTSFINLFVSDYDKKNLKVSELKENVLSYIREKKRVSILEIMDIFDININEAGAILKTLKEEKKINVTD